MSFKDYFDDISDLITESTNPPSTVLYGTKEDEEDLFNNVSPIQFWSLDEGEHSFSVELGNVMNVNGLTEDSTDLFTNTRYVGYAIEHGYDNIIVETSEGSYCITINLNESDDVCGYITEAGEKPLKGKKLSSDRRKKLLKRKEATLKHKALKRPTATNRPKKSPPKGIKVDVLLSNTGKLSPARVERAMRQVRKQPPNITGAKEVQGSKYFRAEYNFNSMGSSKRQIGYADISQDKQYCTEMFCSCSDFFYRLYAPYVAAGLSTWNVPAKFKAKQNANVAKAPHNHRWTVKTNPMGKLFLCKHLWAFMAYYVAGSSGSAELGDDEIEGVINNYFDDVSDDAEEVTDDESEFAKAFGKLFVGQQGKDIEHFTNKDEIKKDDRKQTFYQLPDKDKKETPEDEVDTDEEK